MSKYLAGERENFSQDFPENEDIAKRYYDASWSGKHWGKGGALQLAERLAFGLEPEAKSLMILLSANYAAFGHAAKQIFKGRVWYGQKALISFLCMKKLCFYLRNEDLSIEQLQVFVAALNVIGMMFAKLRIKGIARKYYFEAYEIAKSHLPEVIPLSVEDKEILILLCANMLGNPCVSDDQQSVLRKSCYIFAQFSEGSITTRIRVARSVGLTDLAQKLSDMHGLEDQALKSS